MYVNGLKDKHLRIVSSGGAYQLEEERQFVWRHLVAHTMEAVVSVDLLLLNSSGWYFSHRDTWIF